MPDQVSLFDEPAPTVIPAMYGTGTYPKATPARVKACRDLAARPISETLKASFAQEADEIEQALAEIQDEPLPALSASELRMLCNATVKRISDIRRDNPNSDEERAELIHLARHQRALHALGSARYDGWDIEAYGNGR